MVAKAPPPPTLRHKLTVALPIERAFALFATEMGSWWPLVYTFAHDEVDDVLIEPLVGGRWYERTFDGEETEWGEVRAYEADRRLVLSFAVGADRQPEPPTHASEVEVNFVATGSTATRLELEHRDFERHGGGAAALHEGMGSPQGWPLILASYAHAARLFGA